MERNIQSCSVTEFNHVNISTGCLQNLSLQILDLPAGFSECCSLLCVTLSAAEASVHVAAEFLESPICKAIAHRWDIAFTSLLIRCVKPRGQLVFQIENYFYRFLSLLCPRASCNLSSSFAFISPNGQLKLDCAPFNL